MPLRVEVLPTAEDVSSQVAALIHQARSARRHFVLGVATGRTPRGIYRRLVELCLGSAGLHLVLLDEYLGLPRDDRRSFRVEIDEQLARPLGVPPARLLVPPVPAGGCPPTPDQLAEFEARLAGLGGVDLQLLGIGSNGHIAFNEPGASPTSRTRVVALRASTRVDNPAAFGQANAVPRHAVTQGIGTILDAGRIVLVANGVGKRSALSAAVSSPPNRWLPASALQAHAHATVFADADAASWC